jgi:hypothetical protein
MALHDTLLATAEFTPDAFANFQRHIDPAWIEEALALRASSTATLRKRRLPGPQVIWLVLGMALFRNDSIEEVVSRLDLALPDRRGQSPARSSIPQARARVGEPPLEWLFEKTGRTWAQRSAEAHTWRGLRLFGFDGSTFRVADTQENRDAFGGQSAEAKRGASGYPLVRIVALMALRSHLLAAARFGSYDRTSEASLVRDILPAIPEDSLTIADRNFVNAPTLMPIARGGKNRHWLTRAKSNTRMKVVKALGPGDELVELNITDYARKQDPSLPDAWTVRAIRYQRKGFRPQILLTSMLDPDQFPAQEIVGLYHERWELELGYDEIKTEMLERQETIRSKKPAGVRQEIWGILLAYNLVRLEMEQVAREAGVPPTRISFVMALNMMRTLWIGATFAKPGALPKRLESLRANLKRFVLPPRRKERIYPRAVKIKMSNYKRKRPTTVTENG